MSIWRPKSAIVTTRWRREAHESPVASRVLLNQARRARRGSWFSLLLFGVVTLAALPLYQVQRECGRSGLDCTGVQNVRSLDAFSSADSLQSQGRWLSTYRVISVLSVYGLTVYCYRRRGFITGIRSRTWPTVGTGVLASLFHANVVLTTTEVSH